MPIDFRKIVANIKEISFRDRRDTYTLRPLVAPIRLDIWSVDIYSSLAYHWLSYERNKQGLYHPRASRYPSVRYMLSKIPLAIFAYKFLTEKV